MLRLLHIWRGAIWTIAYFSGGFEFVALRWPLDVWSYFRVPYDIWNVKFDIIVGECALLYIWTCDCSYLLGTVWWPIIYFVNNYWWLYVIVIALMRRDNFEKKKNGNCHIHCQLHYWYACWLDIGAWFFLLARLRPTRSASGFRHCCFDWPEIRAWVRNTYLDFSFQSLRPARKTHLDWYCWTCCDHNEVATRP